MKTYNILIVDDDAVVRQGIIAEIDKEDLGIDSILEAENGEQALELFKTTPDIDLIITDIKMPKLDGVGLVKEIKKINTNLPMIIISGFNDFDFLRQAIRYGVNDYLLKPINPIELKDILRTLLEQHSFSENTTVTTNTQLRESTLFRLVEGNISNRELQEKSSTIGIENLAGTFLVAEIEAYLALSQTQKYNLAIWVNDEMQYNHCGNAFFHPTGRIVCILDGTNDELAKKHVLQNIVKKAQLEHSYSLTCKFGLLVEDVESIAFSYNSLSENNDGGTSTRSKIIRDVISYVNEHLAEALTIKQIADEFLISPSYLGTLFKKEMDMHFTEYVNKKRIEYAVVLLDSTTLRVYEIVEKVGFLDKNYFLRLFKKYTGKTPGSIRK